MKWIYLVFLFDVVHSVREYSCPAITDVPPLQARKLRHNDLLNTVAGSAINLAATVTDIDKRKWPMAKTPDHKYEVPYVFGDTLEPNTKEAVYYGMVIIERGTNIIFVEKRDSDEDYIHIENLSGMGCYNVVIGDNNKGPQPIQLGRECANPLSTTHELLHAIGLHHEHQRPDRPISKNATYELSPTNTKPLNSVVGITPYDPFSIMHYKLLENFTLDKSQGWTDLDISKASSLRAFPTPCDFYGVNKLYKGLRTGPPCKDVEIHPMLLHSTERFKKAKFGIIDNGSLTWVGMNWYCNWANAENEDGVKPYFSHNRNERDACQLENNRMYPDFSWIPNAAKETVPLAGADYKDYKVSPNRNQQEYPPQHMCDCLPAPLTEMGFTDNSMFQKCLECVHFKTTTDGVLRCIAGNGLHQNDIYVYLKGSYPNNYYVSNPQ